MEKLKCLFVSYLVTILLLFLMAFLLFRFQIGIKAVKFGTMGVYVISTFVGGFLLGRKQKSRQFLWGLLFGLVYFLVLLILSVGFNRSLPESGGVLLRTLTLCATGGMIGGMAG